MESERKYSCFSHAECEFFPCHPDADPAAFNCLFCYCPLYALGEACGGDYVMLEGGIKDCSSCLFPHRPENYDCITARLAALCKPEEE
ncbi:MAG: metal-binding protein [Ruminococcus sp.]|nr:metal-binding protein [Ruminococcus sp.]